MKLRIATSKNRIFFDTEFNEDGKTIDLISIGMVKESGETYYAVSNEFDAEACNDWVKENVLPHLTPKEEWKTREQIKKEILEFCGKKPEFWANHASYDWVVFCQLFGPMVDLPEGYPTYCMDIKQLEVELGVKKDQLPKQEGTVHDALEDAKYNLVCYKALKEIQNGRS